MFVSVFEGRIYEEVIMRQHAFKYDVLYYDE